MISTALTRAAGSVVPIWPTFTALTFFQVCLRTQQQLAAGPAAQLIHNLYVVQTADPT